LQVPRMHTLSFQIPGMPQPSANAQVLCYSETVHIATAATARAYDDPAAVITMLAPPSVCPSSTKNVFPICGQGWLRQAYNYLVDTATYCIIVVFSTLVAMT
jgi:hypothetical protein